MINEYSFGFTYDVEEVVECEMCEGPCEHMGQLGQLEYFRCRCCGWQMSVVRRARQLPALTDAAPRQDDDLPF